MTPRKVDPYVYVMEWIWRHSKAEGSARFILLWLGRFMRWTPDGFESSPVAMKDLAHDVKMVDSTVRAHIRELGALDGDLEIVKSRRRGETYRYRLRREQRLPLADIAPAAHRRMAAVTPPINGGDSAPINGGDSADYQRSERRLAAVTAPNVGGDVCVDPFSSSEVVRTEEDNNNHHHPRTKDFDVWWWESFPIYNNGAHSDLPPEIAYPIINGLLETRSLARLQQMAILMWLVTPLEHAWIATHTDRSLRVLKHAADWLDLRVGKMPDWWLTCSHTPKCSHERDCHAQEAVS
jgi:DNA-binding transcriptional ArsR family regulator